MVGTVWCGRFLYFIIPSDEAMAYGFLVFVERGAFREYITQILGGRVFRRISKSSATAPGHVCKYSNQVPLYVYS